MADSSAAKIFISRAEEYRAALQAILNRGWIERKLPINLSYRKPHP
jgi:hypothetical protein